MRFINELEEQEKNKLCEDDKAILEEINNYIISNRIIIYYFDRLTRRLYINKLRERMERRKVY
jgi:hypothetical protein